MRNKVVLFLCILALLVIAASVSAHVKYDASGTAIVNGKPFFPIGIYLYNMNTDVLADVHQQGFNTLVYSGAWGVKPSDLDIMKDHGLMFIAPYTDEWLKSKDHPSILGWYLRDEPEMSQSVEDFAKDYQKIKAVDPDHPIGTCHYDWEAMRKYSKYEDFMIISSYPIVAKRTVPLFATGMNIDHVHTVRGANFPVWPAIQTFGGPESDNGIWAVPTPAEVRCMTYVALVHGAKGILFFSYWPQAPRTWNEVGVVSKELHRLTPYLVLPSKKLESSSPNKYIHTRCIKVGDTGILIAVNTLNTFQTAKIKVNNLPVKQFTAPFEGGRIKSVKNGEFTEDFGPAEVHVYQWGETPVM